LFSRQTRTCLGGGRLRRIRYSRHGPSLGREVRAGVPPVHARNEAVMAGEPASLRAGHARRSHLILTSQLSTDMRRSHIRLHKPAVFPHHLKTISAALPHTLADNRGLFTLQLFHQPQHLMPVQTGDLPDLRIRQTGFAVLGPLPEPAQAPVFAVSPSICRSSVSGGL